MKHVSCWKREASQNIGRDFGSLNVQLDLRGAM